MPSRNRRPRLGVGGGGDEKLAKCAESYRGMTSRFISARAAVLRTVLRTALANTKQPTGIPFGSALACSLAQSIPMAHARNHAVRSRETIGIVTCDSGSFATTSSSNGSASIERGEGCTSLATLR